MPSLIERCAAIDWLLLDVDGVLTDGTIAYSDQGDELKGFYVRDGSGLSLWVKAGKKSGLLTGRSSAVVSRRAIELQMTAVFQGIGDKGAGYRKFLQEQNVAAERVCYMGDDIVDLPVLRHCGLAATVADACDEAHREAHYVTRAPGGRGAVREVIELILRAQGLWQTILDGFRQ